MKTNNLLPLLLGLLLPGFLLAQTESGNRTLVWSDEFDGPEIDKTKWAFAGGAGGFGNNEMQWYTNKPENATIEDGHLVITTLKKKMAGWPYTSAKLMTRDAWTYGRFEVRAKLPVGVGSWPAVWMLPRESSYGKGWPDSGELDLMEHVGFDPGVVVYTAHTGSFNHKIGTQKSRSVSVPDAQSVFHVYAIDWSPEKVDFLLDGEVVYTFENMHQTYLEWPFDQPFYLILNTAVGGDWGGREGVDNDSLPWKFSLDWVRIYGAND